MDVTVINTLIIIAAIIAGIFSLFYHAFSTGKDEEKE